MTYSFSSEEADRTRNNEDGECWPTPAQDCERGADQEWSWVGEIHDPTDDLDGQGYP